MRLGLTERQKSVYDGIINFQKEHGYAPSVRELCVICDFASTSSVHAHLKTLEEFGYTKRSEDKARTIVIV